MTPGAVIVAVALVAVPKADWRLVTFYAPAARVLGVVILLVATAFTIWARLVLGLMWSGAFHGPMVDHSRFRPVAIAASSTARAASVA